MWTKGFVGSFHLYHIMSMIFTFLCSTNHAKTTTFDEAFDFQIKLARRKEIKIEDLDNVVKKYLIENGLVEGKMTHL